MSVRRLEGVTSFLHTGTQTGASSSSATAAGEVRMVFLIECIQYPYVGGFTRRVVARERSGHVSWRTCARCEIMRRVGVIAG